MARIAVDDFEHLPLAGIMIKTLLERNAKDPVISRVMESMNGKVALKASQMQIGLDFSGGEVHISPCIPAAPDAAIAAPLDAFLNIGLRKRLIPTLIGRQVRFNGNPLLLLKLARVFRI